MKPDFEKVKAQQEMFQERMMLRAHKRKMTDPLAALTAAEMEAQGPEEQDEYLRRLGSNVLTFISRTPVVIAHLMTSRKAVDRVQAEGLTETLIRMVGLMIVADLTEDEQASQELASEIMDSSRSFAMSMIAEALEVL